MLARAGSLSSWRSMCRSKEVLGSMRSRWRGRSVKVPGWKGRHQVEQHDEGLARWYTDIHPLPSSQDRSCTLKRMRRTLAREHGDEVTMLAPRMQIPRRSEYHAVRSRTPQWPPLVCRSTTPIEKPRRLRRHLREAEAIGRAAEAVIDQVEPEPRAHSSPDTPVDDDYGFAGAAKHPGRDDVSTTTG